MSRKVKLLLAILALCACMNLSGCARDADNDPLEDYGVDAALPEITPAPTAKPADAGPSPSAAPTKAVRWAELPISDADANAARPTRKPSSARLNGQPDSLVIERQNAELDNTGALQPNVASAGMACTLKIADQEYLYFTAADGKLYRTPIASGGAPALTPNGAQKVADDAATGLITSLHGDVVYISGGKQLIKLAGGDGAGKKTLATFDKISCLTRWDDALFFVAEQDGQSAIYVIRGAGAPELMISDVSGMQIDVVNRRIVALSAAGMAAYSLTGEYITPMIDGELTAFCFSGANIYYATDDAIYMLSTAGAVQCVAHTGAKWLGAHNSTLFYLDSSDILHRSTLDGTQDETIASVPAYNPTLMGTRIAYGAAKDSGITGSVKY